MVLLLVKLQKIPPLLGHWGRIIDVLYDNVGDLLLLHTYDGPTQFIYIYIYPSLCHGLLCRALHLLGTFCTTFCLMPLVELW